MVGIWAGIGSFLLMGLLTACAEGRWVHQTKTEAQGQQDWDMCKTEVLSGAEHQKNSMACSINLSGCMQSKGYRYLEAQPSRVHNAESPAAQ